MPETFFSSTEGRLVGAGLALTGLMFLAFGIGWHVQVVPLNMLVETIQVLVIGIVLIALAIHLLGRRRDRAA